ncbi:MAG: amidohydrolase [Candidatus Lokiarchaeota archaeon]|nr:amidohydrolase [Candidatus Lokiarchaeota archaeon]
MPSEITLFYNCTILAIDEAGSVAEAMAVHDGMILAVGTLVQVRQDIAAFMAKDNPGTGHEIHVIDIDASGACIVPGFIDSHLHPGLYIYFKTQLDLSKVRSLKELEQAIKEDDATRPAGEWIFGKDLMEDLFDDPGERHFPTRRELDRAAPSRPVLVIRHDLHICAVNSAGLAAIGVDKDSMAGLAVAGGEIRIDVDGEPTGVFTELATAIPLERTPMPTMDRLKVAGKLFSAEIASHGITTFGGVVQLGEEGIAGKAGAIEMPLMELMIAEHVIAQDMVFYLVTTKPRQMKRIDTKLRKIDGGAGRLVVGGLKLYADGSFGARTAAMFEPFSDSPSGERGFMIRDEAALLALFKETDELGYQVAIHSIGDKANRVVVDLFSRLGNGRPLTRRHRIEHASTVDAGTIADAAKLGITFCCQPAFINSEYTWLEARLGADRVKQTYPFKSILDGGVALAGASDAPVESANVLKAIQACVTRHGLVPEECIPVMDAIRMFTISAARALGQENVKGSIEPGKLADFVLLDKDPRAVPVDKIESIQVRATYHRGTRIF